MRRILYLAIVFLAAVLVLAHRAHAADAGVRYLDSDVPDQVVAVVKPGDVLVLGLPYDVTFSSIHGDDENKDSEFMVADIHVRVGLGDDDVKLWVWKGGRLVFEYTVTRQDGFVLNEHKSGSVTIRLDVDCNGLLSVIFNGRRITSTTISRSVNVVGDKDVVVLNRGRHHCNTNSYSDGFDDTDWENHGKIPVSDLVLGAGAIGLAGAAAYVIARRR